MKNRSVLIAFTMLLFCSSLAFGAGSFFETANQADESGQAVKQQEPLPPEDEILLEEDEAGKSGIDKDREKDSPADHDSGKGNDDKVAKDKDTQDNSLTGADRLKDSPADHDNGKGNDDKVAKDKEPGTDRLKDSPADQDNGKGNDDKVAKDKNVIDPENPSNNDEFDPKGEFNPGKMGNCSDKDLINVIGNTHKINVTGWQFGHGDMRSGFGWSHSHLFEIYRTLYVLPRFFIGGGLNLHWGGCGFSCGSLCHLQGNSIFFCNYAPMRQGWLSALFMREMGRFLFLSSEFAYLRAQWIKMFWMSESVIKIKPPFKFVCRTPDEDFGESVKSYWCCGDWFHSRDRARYEFVHRLVMKGKKFSGNNGGCGCDESDEAAGTFPKQPVATSSVSVGGGDHGASGKTDLNDKNKIDNASKANNTAKTTTVVKPIVTVPAKPVVKTPAKPVVTAPAKPVVKTPAKPVVTAPAKPVVKTPAKPVVTAPAKPVVAPTKTVGGGDHGASGKADLNDKNKVDNASKANNTPTQTAKPAAPAAKPATPAAKPATPAAKPATPAAKPATPAAKPATPAAKPATPAAKPATPAAKPATPAAKPATPAAKPATPAAKPATPAAKPATPAAKPATPAAKPAAPVAKPTTTTPVKQPAQTGKDVSGTSGGGDHGASGKTDQNDKNKDNNAATANNSTDKTKDPLKK